jgi:hypothetical protein
MLIYMHPLESAALSRRTPISDIATHSPNTNDQVRFRAKRTDFTVARMPQRRTSN